VEGGCHDAGNPRIALVEYSNIMNGIQEGNADGSWFYHVIGRGMPPGAEPQLTTDQLDIIRQWIDQGAKNSNCDDVACDSTHVHYADGVSRIFADYCNGCHNSVVFPNSRSFTTLDLIRNAVKADPERFLRSIRYDQGTQANMPPTFQMNECDRHKVEAWVHQGMPD
jgi:mono/diheme cytochrome c family protein